MFRTAPLVLALLLAPVARAATLPVSVIHDGLTMMILHEHSGMPNPMLQFGTRLNIPWSLSAQGHVDTQAFTFTLDSLSYSHPSQGMVTGSVPFDVHRFYDPPGFEPPVSQTLTGISYQMRWEWATDWALTGATPLALTLGTYSYDPVAYGALLFDPVTLGQMVVTFDGGEQPYEVVFPLVTRPGIEVGCYENCSASFHLTGGASERVSLAGLFNDHTGVEPGFRYEFAAWPDTAPASAAAPEPSLALLLLIGLTLASLLRVRRSAVLMALLCCASTAHASEIIDERFDFPELQALHGIHRPDPLVQWFETPPPPTVIWSDLRTLSVPNDRTWYSLHFTLEGSLPNLVGWVYPPDFQFAYGDGGILSETCVESCTTSVISTIGNHVAFYLFTEITQGVEADTLRVGVAPFYFQLNPAMPTVNGDGLLFDHLSLHIHDLPIPEPFSGLLLGAGGIVVGVAVRRRD